MAGEKTQAATAARSWGTDSVIKVFIGGLSTTASNIITNPIDLMKTRLQLQGELEAKGATSTAPHYPGLFRGMKVVVANEGIGGLYKGILPSVLRAFTYSGVRLSLYDGVREVVMRVTPPSAPAPHPSGDAVREIVMRVTPPSAPAPHPSGPPSSSKSSSLSMGQKMLCGAIAGGLSSGVATPTDMLKVQLQASRTHSTSMIRAMQEIYSSRGIRAFYTGCAPTVMRAVVAASVQLPVYDHSKRILERQHDAAGQRRLAEGPVLHFIASTASGAATAIVANPIDVVKTRRLMCSRRGPSGAVVGPQHASALSCFVNTCKTEGIRGLYKGLFANWVRVGSHTTLTLLIYEQLRRICGIAPV